MGRQVQTLDAAAGAQIECTADLTVDGQLRQGGGRGTDAEHIVGFDRLGPVVETGCRIGHHPAVPLTFGGFEAVGTHVDRGLDAAIRAYLQQTFVHQCLQR
ncbi:hypothetical protein SDC9_186799 [bioreactor metagenome]|uniref:Uncharacterized protein n=1 Tax=bioreactor metagenome TaxID=1076179 RepID=A0A645HJS4_9ZZZZ